MNLPRLKQLRHCASDRGVGMSFLMLVLAMIGAPQTGRALDRETLVDRATAQSRSDQAVESLADGRIRVAVPLQRLVAEIGADGLRLRSTDDAGGAGFLQRLRSFGRAGERLAAVPGELQQEGDLVVLRHGQIVEEFSVSAAGLRQDFVLASGPLGEGLLQLDLAFDGAEVRSLETPVTSAVQLRMADGRALHYHALQVTDALGRVLPAQMRAVSREVLRIEVDDAAAHYPLRIDPTFVDADWTSLQSPGFDGSITAAVYGDGRLYIGGEFTAANGVSANYVASWDGDTWSPLGTGLSGSVFALAWDATEQRLFAGGAFYATAPDQSGYIAVWDGEAWAALGSGMDDYVWDLAWDATNERLFVGGSFTTAGGSPAANVAVWDASGGNADSQWSALGEGTGGANGGQVRSLAWDDDNERLYVGGHFDIAGDEPANYIATWKNGEWSPLGAGTNGGVDELTLDSVTDRVFAGGNFTEAGGQAVQGLALWQAGNWSSLGNVDPVGASALAWDAVGQRLLASSGEGVATWDGDSWSAIGEGLADHATAIALNHTGSMLFVASDRRDGTALITPTLVTWDGDAWTGSGGGPNGAISTLVWDSTRHKLYVGGMFAEREGERNFIAVWNGDEWAALGEGLNWGVASMALDPASGTLYVGGAFDNGGDRSFLAAWDGETWSPIGGGVDGPVKALAWDASGSRLFVAGVFSHVGGVAMHGLVCWDGVQWSTVGSGMFFVERLLWDDDRGLLYAGGQFETGAGSPGNHIAVWNGTAWAAMGAGLSMSTGPGNGVNVYAMALDAATGRLFVGGYFGFAGGVEARYIAAWNGSAWSSLGSGMDAEVRALAWDENGERLFAGGDFFNAGSAPAEHLAVWENDAWSAAGSGTNAVVLSMVTDADRGRLFAAGRFTRAGDEAATIAALDVVSRIFGDGFESGNQNGR